MCERGCLTDQPSWRMSVLNRHKRNCLLSGAGPCYASLLAFTLLVAYCI